MIKAQSKIARTRKKVTTQDKKQVRKGKKERNNHKGHMQLEWEKHHFAR